MEDQPTFFDFAAEVGLTKHIGGVEATEALMELCHVGQGSYVLDVGCGVGVTPCHIAKKYGCRVVGVDLNEGMVERSKERAIREQVADRVEFKVADAQDLPFENALFDAVFTESVTSFPEDKQKAVNEYARVTKSGGYVALNESTWRQAPPPEVLAWADQDVVGNVKPLPSEDWVALLERAGLRDIVVRTYEVNAKEETKGIVRRYGWGGTVRVWWRMLLLYARSPAYRSFVRQTRERGVLPENLEKYYGYGLFVGQK
jgi:arsenite methyltransferase